MIDWDNIIETILGLLLGIAICLMLCTLNGCSTARPAMATGRIVYKTDTLYKTNIRADTIRLLDSILVNQYVRGDTVYKETTAYKWRDRVSLRVDTLYKTTISSDTIRQPVPVERKLTPWERTVYHTGNLLVGILAAVAVWLIAWIARRKLKA